MSLMKISWRWWDPIYSYKVEWNDAYEINRFQMCRSLISGDIKPIQKPCFVMRPGVKSFLDALPDIQKFGRIWSPCKCQPKMNLSSYFLYNGGNSVGSEENPPALFMTRKSDALMLKLHHLN